MKTIVNVWMQPVYARLNLHGMRSLVILLLSVPVISQVVVFFLGLLKDSPTELKVYLIALLISLGGVVALLFYGWFIMLAMNIGLQYSPSNAKLIPGFKRHLQAALVLPIVFISICSTLIFALIAHQWSMLPFLATTVFLSFLMLTIRSQWAVLPFVLLFQVPAAFEKNQYTHPFKLVQDQIGLSMDFQCFLIAVLVLVLTQAWLFAVRDDAHFKMYQRAQVMKTGLQGQNIQENKLSLGFATVYLKMMTREINRLLQLGRDANRGGLVSHVFGPRIHCSTIFTQVAVMGLLVLIVLRLMSLLVDKKNDFWEGFGQGFGWGFVGVYLIVQPVVYLLQVFYRIYQTRSEQSLVCLTPCAGTRKQMDQELIRFLLRQFGIFYCVSVIATLCFLIQWQTIDLKSAALILTLTAVFPSILAIPTAHSKMRSMNDHPVAWAVLPGGVLLVLGLSSFIIFPLKSALIYPIVVIPLTLYFLARKLRQLKGYVQFPAGCGV